MMNSGPLDRKILSILDTKGNVDTLELASEWKIDHQVVVGAVKSLEVLVPVFICCFGYMAMKLSRLFN